MTFARKEYEIKIKHLKLSHYYISISYKINFLNKSLKNIYTTVNNKNTYKNDHWIEPSFKYQTKLKKSIKFFFFKLCIIFLFINYVSIIVHIIIKDVIRYLWWHLL